MSNIPASAFRRSVMAETAKKKGGKGFKGSWREKLRTPHTPSPATPIFLVRCSYQDPNPSKDQQKLDAMGRPVPVIVPYRKVRIHKRKMLRNGGEWYEETPCSAGWDAHNPQQCVPCHAQDLGDKSVSLGERYLFTAVHLVKYHQVPATDRNTGQFLQKRNGGPGEYLLNSEECEGQSCNFCRVMRGYQPILQQGEQFPNYPPGSIKTTFAMRRYMDTGSGHLGDILGFDEVIGRTCTLCSSSMQTESFDCSECGNIIWDMQNPPGKYEDCVKMSLNPVPCMNCRKEVYLKETKSCPLCATTCEVCGDRLVPTQQMDQEGFPLFGCQRCQQYRQGREGQSLTVFDVVVFVVRHGEQAQSHLVMEKFKTIEQFERELDPESLQILRQSGKNLRQLLAEVGQPYDFDQLLPPLPLPEQAKKLDLPMINAGPAPGQQANPYGGGQQAPGPQAPVSQPVQYYGNQAAPVQQQGQQGWSGYPNQAGQAQQNPQAGWNGQTNGTPPFNPNGGGQPR